MSTVLDAIIARGFNIDRPEAGTRFVNAKNRRQVLDSNLETDELNRDIGEFNLAQMVDQVQRQQQTRGAVGDYQAAQAEIPEVQAAQMQALENSNGLERISPELRDRAMGMLQQPASEITERQQKALNLITQNYPDLFAQQMYAQPEPQGGVIAPEQAAAMGLPTDNGEAWGVKPDGTPVLLNKSGMQVNVGQPPSYVFKEMAGENGETQIVALDKNNPSNTMVVGEKAQELGATARATVASNLQKIQLGRQQLERVRRAWEDLNKTSFPGVGAIGAGQFGQGLIPSEAGNRFDVAADSMSQTLRSLSRTPGEGQMSDKETALALAPVPKRTNYESVTVEQMDELEAMFDEMERGYTEMLEGAPAAQGGTQPPIATGGRIRVDADGNVIND